MVSVKSFWIANSAAIRWQLIAIIKREKVALLMKISTLRGFLLSTITLYRVIRSSALLSIFNLGIFKNLHVLLWKRVNDTKKLRSQELENEN